MKPLRFVPRAGAALALFLLVLSPSFAQATRTWVSGVGDDVNPGSRTAPCKTFAGAIAKTAAGGEINCLDAGGFGAVTISKSITIDGGGTFASIINHSTNGVIIKGDGIVVTIRNLSINGAGAGLCGIKFQHGAVLNVEHCVISGQTIRGIEVTPGQKAKVFIKDTIIRGTHGDKEAAGMNIAPADNCSVNAILENVRLEDNFYGLVVNDRVNVTVRNSVVAGNGFTGFTTAGTTGPINLNLENCLATYNFGFGICNANLSADSIIRLSNVTVVGNSSGITTIGSGSIISFGNNRIEGNTIGGKTLDGAPTETKPLQ